MLAPKKRQSGRSTRRRQVAPQPDSGASKRVRRPLTNDERAAIALRWLEPLKEGKHALSLRELKKLFHDEFKRDLDQRTIKASIQYAFRTRLVEVREGNMLPACWRKRDLERALVKRWPVKSAIVVETSETVTNSNTIHHQLGLMLAASIEDNRSNYFRDNDIIGIGSGRAIHYLVTAFDPALKFNISNITLMSLTGSIYPEAPVGDPTDLVDADANTVLYANCFAQRTHVRTIAFPLAHNDVSTVRRNTWLHDSDYPDDKRSGAFPLIDKERRDYANNEFKEHIPTHAFVGVGVLGHNHRLYHEGRYGAKSTMLTPVREKLIKLINLSENISKRSSQEYYPCADICNRFFFVEPPKEVRISDKERSDMDDYISHINNHMLTVTKTQLAKVEKINLIAGTVHKTLAIRRLLERKESKRFQPLEFSVICTDSKTAQLLLV